MREALGDIGHPMVLLGKGDGFPLQERWGIRSQIDRDIIDGAARASDEFCLCVRADLVMHAPQGAPFLVEGHVALDKYGAESVFFELLAAPAPGEETALVFTSLHGDHEHAAGSGYMENHRDLRASDMGVRSRSHLQKSRSSISPFPFRYSNCLTRVKARDSNVSLERWIRSKSAAISL